MDRQAEPGLGIALPETLIDLATFRACMRQVPGAVTVVTTVHEGTRGGLTATAVCSVSADPPQILVCVNRSSSAEAVIVAAGRFGVSFLSPTPSPPRWTTGSTMPNGRSWRLACRC